MTDRELLELAAKAAGVELGWNKNDTPPKPFRMDNADWWNPLIADGDALRLAVKLRLHVDHSRINASSVSVWIVTDTGATSFDEDGDDPYAATRRAIVRAAAEIGKSLA